MPAALGHESAGVGRKGRLPTSIIVKHGTNNVVTLSVGFCGTCANCTTGRTVLCTDTSVKIARAIQTGCPGRGGEAAPVSQSVVVDETDGVHEKRHCRNPEQCRSLAALIRLRAFVTVWSGRGTPPRSRPARLVVGNGERMAEGKALGVEHPGAGE